MQEHAKKPAIRFKGFTDDWEQRKLNLDFEILQNNTLSRAELNEECGIVGNIHYGDILVKYGEVVDLQKEKVPYIESREVAKKYKESFLQDGDVVISDTAEDTTVGKCTEIKNVNRLNLLAGLHTIPLRPKQKYASGYLGYYMNSDSFHNMLLPFMQGTKVTSISKSALQKLTILYPNDAVEQRKISEYFTSIDRLITLHQRKYDKLVNIKKAMLEKMFPKDGAKVPEIRFKGFTDDWEQRKLGEIAERVVRKNNELQSTLPLTISAQYGLVDQITYFNNRVASNNIRGYYLIKNGEFAYNKSSSDGYPFGAVKRLDYYPMGVLSTLYIVFSVVSGISSQFLVSYYDTNNWHKEVAERAAEGARNHGLLNISADDFFDTDLKIPKSVSEQEIIGGFLKTLDRLITLHQRKLEKLQNLKQACLEKLFV